MQFKQIKELKEKNSKYKSRIMKLKKELENHGIQEKGNHVKNSFSVDSLDSFISSIDTIKAQKAKKEEGIPQNETSTFSKESRSISPEPKQEPDVSKKPITKSRSSQIYSVSDDLITVKVNSPDLSLTTTLNGSMLVKQVREKLMKRFPGETEEYCLFIKGKKTNSLVQLDEEKSLLDYKDQIEKEGSTLIFDKPLNNKESNENLVKKSSRKSKLLKTRSIESVSTIQLIKTGNYENLEKYLQTDAKQKLSQKSTDGETAMHAAIASKNSKVLDLILKYYKEFQLDVNEKDNFGWTSLHTAAFNCNGLDEEDIILKKLLEYPNTTVNAENEDKNLALHFFAQTTSSSISTELGKMMIERFPASVNKPNNNGETPLHKAIFNKTVRILIVKLLIQYNADVNIGNSANETALHYAVRLQRKDLVKILLNAGADIKIKESKSGKTPYDLAVESGQHDIAETLKNVKSLLKFLLELKLETYLKEFLNADIDLKVLAKASEEELEKILKDCGIDAYGSRLRFKKACTELKNRFKRQSLESQLIKAQKENRNSLHEKITNEFKERNAWTISQKELEFTKELGSGSFGKVFKGLFKGKKVAIKVLKVLNEASYAEFKKECQVMSAIDSPHVIKFYGACLDPKICLVIEYCKRGNLRDLLKDQKVEIEWKFVLKTALGLAKGIFSLHSLKPQPIFHRDIKSPNLLVDANWEVKVCDMGLARFNTDSNLDTLGKLCGTYSYLAPEIYFGKVYTDKSDVFSMGILYWEVANRFVKGKYEAPYDEYSINLDFQIFLRVAEQNLRPTIPEGCPTSFVQLLHQCLHPEPETRPNSGQIVEILTKMQDSDEKSG